MKPIPDLSAQITATLKTENIRAEYEALQIVKVLVERARAFGMSDIAILRALGEEDSERSELPS